MEETNPNVLNNTVSYMEFLVEQLLDETDENLASFDNYSDISLYMSEYVYLLQYVTIEEAESTLYTLPDYTANLTPSEKRSIAAAKDVLFDKAYKRYNHKLK